MRSELVVSTLHQPKLHYHSAHSASGSTSTWISRWVFFKLSVWNNKNCVSVGVFYIYYFPKRFFFFNHCDIAGKGLVPWIMLKGLLVGLQSHTFSVKELGRWKESSSCGLLFFHHMRRIAGSDPAAKLNPGLCYSLSIVAFLMRLLRSLAENWIF